MKKKQIIESLNLLEEAINELFSTVVLRKLFLNNKDENKPTYCYLFIPIDSSGFIVNVNLESTEYKCNDIINTFYEQLGYEMYDDGQIKMSYLLTEGIDNENMYSTADVPIIPDIYNKLGSMAYGKIGFSLI